MISISQYGKIFSHREAQVIMKRISHLELTRTEMNYLVNARKKLLQAHDLAKNITLEMLKKKHSRVLQKYEIDYGFKIDGSNNAEDSAIFRIGLQGLYFNISWIKDKEHKKQILLAMIKKMLGEWFKYRDYNKTIKLYIKKAPFVNPIATLKKISDASEDLLLNPEAYRQLVFVTKEDKKIWAPNDLFEEIRDTLTEYKHIMNVPKGEYNTYKENLKKINKVAKKIGLELEYEVIPV
ncbi:hypothetical protein HYU06_03185 [Candidatus Woesearchaeota archaeon]|nr:hypothetical protein [Candidatus Woesearchaeota archaeon]